MPEELKHFEYRGYFFTIGLHPNHFFKNRITWMLNGYQGTRWEKPLESLGPFLPEVIPGDLYEYAQKNCQDFIDKLIAEVERLRDLLMTGIGMTFQAALDIQGKPWN